ncbi:MAG TPA: hypothetical protein PKU80_02705 [Candidatus Limiplasma sp.]|nr:hypothetical protein [Candidatus Limiplasma sp.]HRX09264.1 hypothetical protein [Candidatus Limiplasma sp.]
MLTTRNILYVFLTTMLYVTLQPYVHAQGMYVEHVYLGLAGGFGFEEIIALRLDDVFIWSLLMLSYLLCVSGSMQMEYGGRSKDTLYRFSSYRSWYASKALAAVICCIAVSFIILISVICTSFLLGNTRFGAAVSTTYSVFDPAWPYCLLAFAFLTMSAVMLTQWQMTIHLISGNIVLTTAAYLTPVVLSLYGASNTYISSAPLYNPINWGMLMRTTLFSQPGTPPLAAMLGQAGIACVCFIIGYVAAPKVNLGSRSRQEG